MFIKIGDVTLPIDVDRAVFNHHARMVKHVREWDDSIVDHMQRMFLYEHEDINVGCVEINLDAFYKYYSNLEQLYYALLETDFADGYESADEV
ncbi:hypothetical protein GZH46_03112, partial [Fragariocoptes setiger]